MHRGRFRGIQRNVVLGGVLQSDEESLCTLQGLFPEHVAVLEVELQANSPISGRCSPRVRQIAPNVKENKEFAKWIQDWILVIQQHRASFEHTRPVKRGSADGQEHSDSAHLSGLKRGAVSGRHIA